MGRRYVYWRGPTGAADKKVDSPHAPKALLAELGRTARVNGDEVSWQGFHIFRYTSAVSAAAVVIGPSKEELNSQDAENLVTRAITLSIKDSGPGSAVSPPTLLRHADRLAAQHYRKPSAHFVLRASLSIAQFPAKQIHIHGCDISALSKRDTRYRISDKVQRRLDQAYVHHLKASEYLQIKCTTEGRTIYEAFTKAAFAIDLLRGLWNFFETYGSWVQRLGPSQATPIGLIHTGPVFTLHPIGSREPSETFWYKPDYTTDAPVYTPKSGWKDFDKSRRWACRRMRQLKYRPVIERLLARHSEALDHTDYDVGFLKLWSVLETITGTVAANYDETIKRASCTFLDAPIARDLLRPLRLHRNRFVHSSHAAKDGHQAMYEIKSFVDSHLIRLIRNDFDATSIEDYGNFLSLPHNLASLKNRIRKLQRAMALHASKSSDDKPADLSDDRS